VVPCAAPRGKRGRVRASLRKGFAAASLWWSCSLVEVGGRGSSRRPRHFSLCRQSKVPNGRAAGIRSLRAAKLCEYQRRPEVRATSWFPVLLAPGGSPLNSLTLKQTRGLIPLALRCSALPHGASGVGCGRACEGTDEIGHSLVSSSAGVPVFIVLGRAPMRPRAAKQPHPPIETTRRRCAAAAVGSRSPLPVGHGEQRRLGRIKGSRLFER